MWGRADPVVKSDGSAQTLVCFLIHRQPDWWLNMLLSALTQSSGCQKQPRVGLFSVCVEVLTLTALTLLLSASSRTPLVKICCLTGSWSQQIIQRLIHKTHVNKWKCPEDGGILMRYLEVTMRRKSAGIWWMLPANDPLLPLCVRAWCVDYHW